MTIFILKKTCLAVAWTALALVIGNDPPLRMIEATQANLRSINHHSQDSDSLDASASAPQLMEENTAVEDGVPISEAELEAADDKALEPVLDETRMNNEDDFVSSSFSSKTDQSLDQSLINKMKNSVSCQISFPSRYDVPPSLTIESREEFPTTVTVVFMDETDQYTVYGIQGKVDVPSTFIFGSTSGESEGDYANIQPKPDTGTHKFTAIVYGNAPRLGPLLSALAGTPSDSKERILGSTDAVVADLEDRNGQKADEVCRCSLFLSYEAMQEATEELQEKIDEAALASEGGDKEGSNDSGKDTNSEECDDGESKESPDNSEVTPEDSVEGNEGESEDSREDIE